jgi:hypothetical protein
MTRWNLVSQSIRISAAAIAMAEANDKMRVRRASQHRFQHPLHARLSPMNRARSGSEQED